MFNETSSSRRDFLRSSACGFGALAFSALAADRASAGAHFAPKAKRVIFLFMQGGVSQVDSFDYKPRLAGDDGKKMPFDDARQRANTGKGESSQRVMKSPWKFAQHGQTGRWVSELFPQMARRVDDLVHRHLAKGRARCRRGTDCCRRRQKRPARKR